MFKTYLFVCLSIFSVWCLDYVSYITFVTPIIQDVINVTEFHIYSCFYT